MESPYYEMTHNFEEENRISLSAYDSGYMKGYFDACMKREGENKMMDYCAKESTINNAEDVCEKEMSTSEVLKETRKALAETLSVLSNIRIYLEGKGATEQKIEEPDCLHNEALTIDRMATNCMGLSHVILDKLFGRIC